MPNFGFLRYTAPGAFSGWIVDGHVMLNLRLVESTRWTRLRRFWDAVRPKNQAAVLAENAAYFFATLELEPTARAVAARFCDLTSADDAYVALPDGVAIRCISMSESTPAVEPSTDHSFSIWTVFQNGEPITLPEKNTTIYYVPLIHENRVLAVVALHFTSANTVLAHGAAMLEVSIPQAAQALH